MCLLRRASALGRQRGAFGPQEGGDRGPGAARDEKKIEMFAVVFRSVF